MASGSRSTAFGVFWEAGITTHKDNLGFLEFSLDCVRMKPTTDRPNTDKSPDWEGGQDRAGGAGIGSGRVRPWVRLP